MYRHRHCNVVGSSFYLSPAVLAPYGNLAILAWVVMGAGAICVGLTFATQPRLVPAIGGPYAYTRIAYGDFAGFLIAWGLWISMWSSLPVIAIAFAGAVMRFVPFDAQPTDGCGTHVGRHLGCRASEPARGKRSGVIF